MKHLNLYFWQRAIIFWFLILWVEYLEGLKIKSIKYQVWSYSSSILIVFVTHMMNLACECEWFMSHNWLIILIIADFLDWPWENVFDPLIYLWCHKILQFLQNTEYFFQFTSSILLAQVWKSPNVSQSNTEAKNREEKLDWRVPCHPWDTLHINFWWFSELNHLKEGFIEKCVDFHN